MSGITAKFSAGMAVEQPVRFRALSISTGTAAVGNGIFAATSFLYYTKILSQPTTVAGNTVAIASLIAVLLSVPFGRAVDRINPLTSNAILLSVQAISIFALVFSGSSTWFFVSVVGVAALISKLKLAARALLIAVSFKGDDRIRVRAMLRTISNVGIGIGSGLAAAVTLSGTDVAYELGLGVTAALYGLSAFQLRHIGLAGTEISPPLPNPQKTRGGLNRRFLGVTVLNGALSAHFMGSSQ